MARKRMIDPAFWEDYDVGHLSIRQRLLLISCLSHADDDGRGRADAALLRNQTFTYDDDVTNDDVKGDRDAICENLELSNLFCMRIYNDAKGAEYFCFPNWFETNKPSNPTKSKIPEPPESIFRPKPHFANDSGNNSEDIAKRSGDIIDEIMSGSRNNRDEFANDSPVGQGRGGEVRSGQSRSGKVRLGKVGKNSAQIAESLRDEILNYYPEGLTDCDDKVDDAFLRFSAAAAERAVTKASSFGVVWWEKNIGELPAKGKHSSGSAVLEGLLHALREQPPGLICAALLKTAKYGGGKARSWKYVNRIMAEMNGEGGSNNDKPDIEADEH